LPNSRRPMGRTHILYTARGKRNVTVLPTSRPERRQGCHHGVDCGGHVHHSPRPIHVSSLQGCRHGVDRDGYVHVPLTCPACRGVATGWTGMDMSTPVHVPITCPVCRGVATGWTGVDMSTPLLPESVPRLMHIR